MKISKNQTIVRKITIGTPIAYVRPYVPFDSTQVGVTIRDLVDSSYVQARQQDIFRDSAFVTDIVDQVYIQTLDRFRDSIEFLDSAEAIKLIDSAHINARIDLDPFLDSIEVRDLIDSAHINARIDLDPFLDSAEVRALTAPLYLDSTETISLINLNVDSTFIDNLVGYKYLDSIEADSAYVQSRQYYFTSLVESSDGTMVISNNLVPDQPGTYGLGTFTTPFKDLFLSGNTLTIGAVAISTDSNNNITLSTVDSLGNPEKVLGGVVTFDSSQSSFDIKQIIDSAYVQERQVDFFRDSAFVTNIVNDVYIKTVEQLSANLELLDSTEAKALIDSYVNTLFINDRVGHLYLDSTETKALIDSYVDTQFIDDRVGHLYLDSIEARDVINADYIDSIIGSKYLDSIEAKVLIDSTYVDQIIGNKYLDSIEAKVLIDSTYIDGVVGYKYLDSVEAKVLIDSNYVQERQYYFDNIREDENGFIRLNNHVIPEDGKTIYLGGHNNRFGGIFAKFGVFGANTVYVGNIGLSADGGSFSITDTQFDSFGFPLPPDSDVPVRKIITVDSSGGSDFDFTKIVDSSYIDRIIGYKYLDSIEVDAAFIDARVRHLYLDSVETKALIDSYVDTQFIDNRVGHLYMDSIEVLTMVDSAYVQARQVDFFRDSSFVTSIVDDVYIQARDRFRDSLEFMDSAEVIELVDSQYIENRIGTNFIQNITTVGVPADGDFVDGAINAQHPEKLETGMTVADGLDYLNEVILNVHKNSYVQNVTFNADKTSGGAGLLVTLNLEFEGNADLFDVDFGDGTVIENTSNTIVQHVYNTNEGSPFTVKVTAKNSNGSGAGAQAELERENYIIIFTANPEVSFKAYDNETGGSEISFWNDGDTVYFENTTTNTDIQGVEVRYTWDWGDSTPNDIVLSDSDAGGVLGPRIAHKFTAQANADVKRDVSLVLTLHSTADPAVIPTGDENQYKIYDVHTVSIGTSTAAIGINSQASNGYNITLVNNSSEEIGSFTDFGNQFKYTFGDGDTELVNVGSNNSGDQGRAINHLYSLSEADQANGVSQQYTAKLELLTGHTLSPFTSNEITFTVEPEVRVTLLAEAETISQAAGDTTTTLYNGDDLDGNDRRLINFTADHQNATSFTFKRNGNSISTGQPSYQHRETSVGNINISVEVEGEPGIINQSADDQLVFEMKAVPPRPAGLDTRQLQWSTRTQYRDPHLCGNYTQAPLRASAPAPGTDLENNLYLYKPTEPVASTDVIQNVGTSNPSDFVQLGHSSTQLVNNITFVGDNTDVKSNGALTVSAVRDANAFNNTYPARFYNVFDVGVELGSSQIGIYSNTLSEWFLKNTADGVEKYSNSVFIVTDDLANCSIVDTGIIQEGNPGNLRFASGIRYYNTDGTIEVINGTAENITGQAFYGPADRDDVVQVTYNTAVDGTGNPLGSTTKGVGWSSILQPTELDNGVPVADIGRGSKYSLKGYVISLTGSNVKSRAQLKWRINSPINVSTYKTFPQTVNMWSGSYQGVNELSIPVSTSLGGTYSDNGIRILDFVSDQTDTPSFTSSTDYYTNDPYTSQYVAPTSYPQALVKYGLIEHDTVDYQQVVPAGPDRSAQAGSQYFTFAFRRTQVANFGIRIKASGISSLRIATPGTTMDGWGDATVQYEGVGVPTLNGTNGCAITGGDIIPVNTSINSTYNMTLGEENLSNSTGNVCLIHIGLQSGQSIEILEIV